MITFDDITIESIQENYPNWPQIPSLPYRILIIRGTRSGKTNALLIVISHQININEIYLYVTYP